MHGCGQRIIFLLAGAALLVLVGVPIGCALLWRPSTVGYGPRSTMSGEKAAAACLEEVGSLIADSDTDGLVAAFSEAARSQDAELAADAEELMGTLGGGSLAPDLSGRQTLGSIPTGSVFVMSRATVTAPDGTVWELHVVDCTYNGDDPTRVGVWAIDVYPADQPDEPENFATSSETSRPGIRFITSWEGWDPWSSPYSPDW